MIKYGGKKLSFYELALLHKMLRNRHIGGRHTDENSVIRGFPKHDRKKVRKALRTLVKVNLVIEYKSTGQTHVSLNPFLISEIKKIVEKRVNGLE